MTGDRDDTGDIGDAIDLRLLVRERWDAAEWGVTQTILADAEQMERGVYGNCLQAAVASVLAVPLDAVPHFSAFLWWTGALELWARGFRKGGSTSGLVARTAPVGSPDDIPLFRHVLSGMSPRGVQHSVVAEEGQVIWDPHPSRAGLVATQDAMWFEPRSDHPGLGCALCGQRLGDDIDGSDA